MAAAWITLPCCSRRTPGRAEPWFKTQPCCLFISFLCARRGVRPQGLNSKLLCLNSGLLGRIAPTAARRQFDCLGIEMRLTTELDELAVAELYVTCT